MEPATWCLFSFFHSLFRLLETEDVLCFRISRLQECVGELGAVFREGKIGTLIVLIFRILRFSTANATARCHTSKTRILTSCNFFFQDFLL